MKHNLIHTLSFKPERLGLGILIIVTVMLGGCGTEAEMDDPEQLVDTIWKLEYIQAEDGSVFSGEEEVVWYPDNFHYLNFATKDSVTNIPSAGSYSFICRGSYEIYDIRKMKIDWDCHAPGRTGMPVTNEQVTFKSMIKKAYSFQFSDQELKLKVEPSESWNHAVMHFVQVEDGLDNRLYAPGEVLVQLEEGVEKEEAMKRIEELNLEWKRFYSTVRVVLIGVPVGEEKKWVELLREEPIIRLTQLNGRVSLR
ncbi:hypothetical protein QLX67_07090 [Balneolaceae bacterium ANBcel3]|nr:hypothetical protein [Balneolaceae bacterium ANBcel3]